MDIQTSRVSSLAVDGEGLCFQYGGRKSEKVLDALNIAVQRGIIYGLLGPSGCGKTTLLRCIVGRLQPSDGTMKIYGKTPGQKGFGIPGPGVGFMPQELALYPEISTEETLTYFGRLYQMNYPEIAERIAFLAEFLNIPDKKKLIKNLSGGQQRRVSLASALIHKPPLLILDEPTVGVDPLLRRNIWKHLQNLAIKDHLTIIITTHYVEEARQADMVGLMRHGRLLAEMNPESLIRRHRVFTLEDVFLRLCIKDTEASEETPTYDTLPCDNNTKDCVWVHQDDVKARYETESSVCTTGCEQYKTALLNGGGEMEGLRNDYSCGGQFRASSVRMSALVNKNVVRLRRNIPLLFFQMFVPSIQVIIFCICVGGEPFDLPMAVVNMEKGTLGMGVRFLEYVDNHTITQMPYSNLSLAMDSVKQGKTWGVVYLGPKFTDSLIERFLLGTEVDNKTVEDSTITLHFDLTNQQIAATLYSKLVIAFQNFAESMLVQMHQNPILAYPPVVLGKPVYGDLDTSFTEFMIPGIILSLTYIMAVGISALSIIIEKKEGLLDRSLIAGVRSWEVIFSIHFVLFFIMLLQVALVLILTFLAFNIPSHGSIVWVIIGVLLVGLEGMAYGLFISCICTDENIAVMIALGSFYPNLLLSGVIWPVEAMPYYLRQFSYCLPLTLISNTIRSVLSRGWDITCNRIWAGYLVSLGWIIPVILLCGFIFMSRK